MSTFKPKSRVENNKGITQISNRDQQCMAMSSWWLG